MSNESGKQGPLRLVMAVIAGLVGAAIIWIVTPYNNYVIAASFISDSYLPVIGLFLILVLVLGINPLLRLVRPTWAFRRSELAIILAMLLTACVIPGQGFMRGLPFSLATLPVDVSGNRRLAEQYEQMNLPEGLFPDRLEYGTPKPASEPFLTQLSPGESVPWNAWTGPALRWGVLVASIWLMMVGLGLIVLPQWRRNERLPFPLLTIQQQLIEDPPPGRLLPPLLARRGFWAAAGVVFVLHLLSGLNTYYPEGVPAIPLSWDLSRLFTSEPLSHLPGHIMRGRLFFLFVGVAFFMPNRIGFSIWFFTIAYGVRQMVSIAYLPPYYGGTVTDHRTGAMFVLAAAVLWLGRRHWAAVFGAMFSVGGDDAQRRDRRAGWMFVAGAGGMWGWLVWAGVHWGWALYFVWFGLMVSLLIARMVAETGMPFIRIDTGLQASLVGLAPIGWLHGPALFFGTIVAILFPIGSRINAAAISTHALALDESSSPRRQGRLALVLVGVLIVGLGVSGAAVLWSTYHHSATLDGRSAQVNPWGGGLIRSASNDLLALESGRIGWEQRHTRGYNQPAHLTFGAALAGALQYACLRLPRWPIHPIGLLMVNTFFSNEAWVSVMLGWMVKILVLRYGGARLYRAAVPLFIGIIMGEVIASIFWGIEPAVRAMMGLPYRMVPVLPL